MAQYKFRHQARRAAVQALYQWIFTQTSVDNLILQFREDPHVKNMDFDYFIQLVKGTVEHVENIDQMMLPHLDREMSSVNPVELAILRLALYELKHCSQVPYKVVLDEALELAKEFGAQAGYRYVNGILDAILQQGLREKKK